MYRHKHDRVERLFLFNRFLATFSITYIECTGRVDRAQQVFPMKPSIKKDKKGNEGEKSLIYLILVGKLVYILFMLLYSLTFYMQRRLFSLYMFSLEVSFKKCYDFVMILCKRFCFVLYA